MKERVTIRKRKDGSVHINATGHKSVGIIMGLIQGERKKKPKPEEVKKP